MPLNLARTVTDQGHYFAVNSGSSTGVASAAAPTSLSDTAPLFTVQNTTGLSASGPSIYLDYVRGYVTAAGTAGVNLILKLELDKIVPTGGTLLTANCTNANDGTTSVGAARVFPTGIAVTSAARIIVQRQFVVPTQTAVFALDTEFTVKFGGIDGYASPQNGTMGAGITRSEVAMPPVVIAPGWCLQVPFIITSQSAASSWCFEFGWVEY
jgi:hypothetical protein